MKYAAGVYHGEYGDYLALYNFHRDVFVCIPNEIGIKHVAHFSYEFGRRDGAVDVYLLNRNSKCSDVAKIVTVINKEKNGYSLAKNTQRTNGTGFISLNQVGLTARMHNVDSKILNINPKSREEITEFTLADIYFFCKRVEAKNSKRPEEKIVDCITPVTEIKYIHPKRVLTPGKQDFVPACILEANLDFGQGCASSLIPKGNTSFDGKTFTGYWVSPWGECAPCYAQQKHKCFIKTRYKFDKKRLLQELRGGFILDFNSGETLGRPIKILRFGKRTEACSPFTREEFVQSLEACVETGTRGVIPTKFLKPDNEIFKLLRRTNSSVLFSISGLDEFEQGAFLQGCSNEERLERAIVCNENKINTLVYLNISNPLQIQEREWRIMEICKSKGIKMQILPIRYKRKDVMYSMSGLNWGRAKGFPDLFDESAGTYYYKGHQMVPKFNSMDPALKSIIGDNQGMISMCHHDSQKTFCGGCGIRKGKITETIKVKKRKYQKKSIKNQSKNII